MNKRGGEHQEKRSTRSHLVLTAGDIQIFKLIYQFRFLRYEHLAILTGRSAKRLHRRIFKLVECGYLSAIRLPLQKHLYALGKAALPVLVEHGMGFPELLEARLRTSELKELFLKHELMVIHVHISFFVVEHDGPQFKLVSWKEGRGLYDSVTVPDHAGNITLPLRPDALFTIEDARRPAESNRFNFFLEADRSTMAQARLRDKMRAYWHYLERGLHSQNLGLKNFKVVTVTLTKARAQSLCHLAASVLPEWARKYFLFASLDDILLEKPGSIFGPIYISPRDGGGSMYPLLPELSSAIRSSFLG